MAFLPLRRLLIPLILLITGIVLREEIAGLDPVYRQLVDGLPYVFLAGAAGLAVYYNRAHAFAVALLLILAYWLIGTRLQASLSLAEPALIYALLSLAAPLTFLLLSLWPECALRSRFGWLMALLVPAELGAGALVYFQFPGAGEALVAFMPALQLKPLFGSAYFLSWPASAAFVASAAVGVAVLLKRDSERVAALLSALIFLFVTLAFFGLERISTVMLGGAGLGLAVSLVRNAHEMAYRDELTGVGARRALNERLESLGRRYVLAMVDVDHFKQFNDRHGHDVGDEVLKMVAARLARIRGGGTVFRYGGEEFCVVFPRKSLNRCRPLLEAARTEVEDYRMSLRDKSKRPQSPKEGRQRRGGRGKNRTISVTVSIGAAERNTRLTEPGQVLKAADAALYKAKQRGRNRVVC